MDFDVYLNQVLSFKKSYVCQDRTRDKLTANSSIFWSDTIQHLGQKCRLMHINNGFRMGHTR